MAPAAVTIRPRARRRPALELEDQPATVGLHPGSLLQVLDSDGTWHAATVGAGVLCSTIRDAARTSSTTEGYDPTTTVSWDHGADLIDCPDPRCWTVRGRI